MKAKFIYLMIFRKLEESLSDLSASVTPVYTVVHDGTATDLEPFKVNVQESF